MAKTKAELAAYARERYAARSDVREKARAYYKRVLRDPGAKEQRNERDRLYNTRIKTEVLRAYGSVCQCCHESHPEFLAIDHVDGNGNEHRRTIGKSGGKSFYIWLRKNKYPPGFRVLCHNCNFSYGLYGHCPHQSGGV